MKDDDLTARRISDGGADMLNAAEHQEEMNPLPPPHEECRQGIVGKLRKANKMQF